jgi:hypothetical protein
MAVNLLASLRYVPWSKVISMTPAIVESGAKLWDRLSRRRAQASAVADPAGQPPPSTPEALAAIEIRLTTLERKTAELGEEAVSSFQVVKSIVDQNAQVVQAVDVLLARTQLLLRVGILLGIVCLVLLVLVLAG